MLSTTGPLAPAITSAMIVFLLWKGFWFVWRQSANKSSLHRLRGPKSTSIFFGNLNELLPNDNGDVTRRWVEEYGGTLRFNGLLNMDQLFTMDTIATNHILSHSIDYQKPPATRQGLAELFGEGLVVVEGTEHRQQRRVMNPAFGPAQIRELTGTFLDKALQLRDVWSSEIANDPAAAITGTRVDVVPWLNKVTLDIIGLTGFNYDFNSLDSSSQLDELSEAFSTMFTFTQSVTVLDIVLRSIFPFLRLIPSSGTRKIQAAKNTMTMIGKELLMNAKTAALTGDGVFKKDGLYGRDLFSLLVKANIATDIPESQKLSDEHVMAQVSTFLFAGHETTSAAVSWALYAMTQAPKVQRKLRDELLSVNTDTPSMEELMELPYLDTVVKETLRVYPPFPIMMRVAMKDDVLPVNEPYVDKYGTVCDSISIAKGDQIVISILEMQRSKKLWGPDAHEFRPERWNNIPEAVSQIPGVWAHLLTFSNGPRACIGYRFTVVELKAVLFCLVRAFDFELAVPVSELYGRTTIARRLVLRGDPTHEPQLPLIIRPYQKE